MQRLSTRAFYRACLLQPSRQSGWSPLQVTWTLRAWLASGVGHNQVRRFTGSRFCCENAGATAPAKTEDSSPVKYYDFIGKENPPEPPAPAESELVKYSVFIKNFPFKTTVADLIDVFSEVKGFTSARILRDRLTQRSKGCGFLAFADAESAEAALQLNGKAVVGDRVVTLERIKTEYTPPKRARLKPWTTIYVGATGRDMTADQLRQHFGKFGFVKAVIIPGGTNKTTQGYAHVRFVNTETAKEVVNNVQAMIAYGRTLRLEYTRSPYRRVDSEPVEPASIADTSENPEKP